MSLILQIVGPAATQLGAAARHTFRDGGGSIGRSADNAWVIPSQYISGRHARIHHRDGVWFLEDTSTNGVFLGSRDNRLPKGQQHPLQSGERFYIDEFEITVELEVAAPAPQPPAVRPQFASIPEDIFGASEASAAPLAGMGGGLAETDPLKALGLGDAPVRPRPGPRLEEVEGASALRERVLIPATVDAVPPPASALPATGAPDAPAAPAAAGFQIPDDWDPMDAAQPAARSPQTQASQPAPPRPRRPAVPETPDLSRRAPLQQPAATPAPPRQRTAAAGAPPAAADASITQTSRQPQLDLAALLEAAGVPASAATPAVARELGEILHIVVAGVMEVLAARDKIKDEFRIRHTTFKAADNNPLKFSANVEDALYNLLVKRNPAYLGPVDAFEDGFADIRNHQMAMLAGMRVAYEAMVRRFDPERLQERFDARGSRGALLSLPGRMRYWEQFSEHYRDMVKDPEASFRELFGAEFTRAYEEQMLRLRTLSRSQKRGS